MSAGSTEKRVFISAVTKEFADPRGYLREKIALPNRKAIVQEDFAQSDVTLLEKLYRAIFESDAVVHLVGSQRGIAPTPNERTRLFSAHQGLREWLANSSLGIATSELQDITYTQWEAYFALYCAKPLLCFHHKMAEEGADAAQEKHRLRLRDTGLDRGKFDDKKKLAIEVLRALQDLPANPGFSFLAARDFERDPAVDLPKMAAIGRRPTLALLRDEQYMDRSAQLADLYASLTSSDRDEQTDDYGDLPVFWISGASGSGKSVLLLQLMKKKVYEGRRVLWLADDVSRLEPTLDAIIAGTGSSPDYIFVDDLYTPRNQETLDLQSIRRKVSEHLDTDWPTIVTCGPGQYFDAFSSDAAGDGVSAHKWTLEKVSPDEAAGIEAFFSRRSGKPVNLSTPIGDEGGLFISMATELQFGNLLAFSERFVERIKALDLIEPLRPIIALNRLYIAGPSDWLTEDEKNRLATFNEDAEFEFDETSVTQKYLRLTHPHLSDGVYRALCGRDANSRTFATDIIAIFERAIASDIETAIALLKAFNRGEERVEAIDMHHVTGGLCKILGEGLHTAPGLSPREKAELATALAAWDARSPEYGLSKRLEWDVHTYACEAIDALDERAGGLWLALIRAAPGRLDYVDRVLAYLASKASQSELSWHQLFTALRAGSAGLDAGRRKKLALIGLERLEADAKFTGSANVIGMLVAMIDAFQDREISSRIRKVALVWLDENWFNRSLPMVARAFFPKADEAEKERIILRSFDWLDTNAGYGKIWGPFFNWFSARLKARKDDRLKALFKAVIDMLSKEELHWIGTYVLQVISENLEVLDEDPTPRLKAFALERLEDTSYEGWSYYLEYLETLDDLSLEEKERILTLGLEWLEANVEKEEMVFVWTPLFYMTEGLEYEQRSKLGQFIVDVLSAELRPRNAVPLAANLVNSGREAFCEEPEKVEAGFKLCHDLLHSSGQETTVPYLAQAIVDKDHDIGRRDAAAALLARNCLELSKHIAADQSETPTAIYARQNFRAAWRVRGMPDFGRLANEKEGFRAVKALFDDCFDETLAIYEIGDEVEVVVTGSSAKGDVFALLPTGFFGMLPASAVPAARLEEIMDAKVGEILTVRLDRIDAGSKRIGLSALSVSEVHEINQGREDYLASLSVGQKIVGTVTSTKSYGVLVGLEHGLGALIHSTKLFGRSIDEFEVGSQVESYVYDVKREEARIELSILHPAQEKELQREAQDFVDSLVIDQKLHARVKSIANYGLFMSLGCGVDGLLHKSALVGSSPEDFEIGDEFDVYLQKIDSERRRIQLKLFSIEQEAEIERAKSEIVASLVIGQEIRGRVESKVDYGAFVEISKGVSGLLHETNYGSSEISDYVIGEEYDFYVENVELERMRVSLAHPSAKRGKKAEPKGLVSGLLSKLGLKS